MGRERKTIRQSVGQTACPPFPLTSPPYVLPHVGPSLSSPFATIVMLSATVIRHCFSRLNSRFGKVREDFFCSRVTEHHRRLSHCSSANATHSSGSSGTRWGGPRTKAPPRAAARGGASVRVCTTLPRTSPSILRCQRLDQLDGHVYSSKRVKLTSMPYTFRSIALHGASCPELLPAPPTAACAGTNHAQAKPTHARNVPECHAGCCYRQAKTSVAL